MILDQFKLDEKVAVVTGASRGLGQYMAIALAEAGADIVCVARSSMQETEDAIIQTGRRAVQVRADLGEESAVDVITKEALESFGRIDILVNNAGIIRRAPVTQFTKTDWDEVMDVNLRSLFLLSQAATEIFIQQGTGGKIINIASMLSYQGGILVPSYTASKSAVLGLTKLFANELAGHNINVNAIAPGYMATDNTAPLRADTERNADILKRIPAGKWGDPDELMGAVVFLASDASSYMHGSAVVVDGGWLAR